MKAQAYDIAYLDEPGANFIAPENPLRVPAGETVTTSVFIVQSAERFTAGERRIRLRIDDNAKFEREFTWRLPGPVNGTTLPEAP